MDPEINDGNDTSVQQETPTRPPAPQTPGNSVASSPEPSGAAIPHLQLHQRSPASATGSLSAWVKRLQEADDDALKFTVGGADAEETDVSDVLLWAAKEFRFPVDDIKASDLVLLCNGDVLSNRVMLAAVDRTQTLTVVTKEERRRAAATANGGGSRRPSPRPAESSTTERATAPKGSRTSSTERRPVSRTPSNTSAKSNTPKPVVPVVRRASPTNRVTSSTSGRAPSGPHIAFGKTYSPTRDRSGSSPTPHESPSPSAAPVAQPRAGVPRRTSVPRCANVSTVASRNSGSRNAAEAATAAAATLAAENASMNSSKRSGTPQRSSSPGKALGLPPPTPSSANKGSSRSTPRRQTSSPAPPLSARSSEQGVAPPTARRVAPSHHDPSAARSSSPSAAANNKATWNASSSTAAAAKYRAGTSGATHPCESFLPQWGNAMCGRCKMSRQHHAAAQAANAAIKKSAAQPAASSGPSSATPRVSAPSSSRPRQVTSSGYGRTASAPRTSSTERPPNGYQRSGSASGSVSTTTRQATQKLSLSSAHNSMSQSTASGSSRITRKNLNAAAEAVHRSTEKNSLLNSPDKTPNRTQELRAAQAFAESEREAWTRERDALQARLSQLDGQRGALKLQEEWSQNQEELKALRDALMNPTTPEVDKDLFREHYKTLEGRGNWLQDRIAMAADSGSIDDVSMLVCGAEGVREKLRELGMQKKEVESQLAKLELQISALRDTSYETLLFAMKPTDPSLPSSSEQSPTRPTEDDSQILPQMATQEGEDES